jgi:hypothetical protein
MVGLNTQTKGGAFFAKSSFSSSSMIKSLSKSEGAALVALLPAYTEHMRQHPNSLLVKIFGLFRTVAGQHFMVLENVLPLKPVVVYDMKGSTIHRRAAEGSGTLLDKNWKDDNRFVLLNAATRDAVMDQIAKDAQLLRAHNLMDYSLLVGVAEKTNETNLGVHCFVSGDGESVYELGIIDFLQEYNTKKKMTHAIKSVVHQGDQLSTVAPELYADRFVEFLRNHVFDTVYDEDALM